MSHYLGLTYAVPHEAGLASEAKAVGKRLGELLDSLGNMNNFLIEQGEFTDTCWQFKVNLIEKLKADGWRISIPNNNYKVLPPKGKTTRRKVMSFMQQQITKKLDWYEIETNQGTWFVAVEDVGRFVTLDNASDTLAEFCEGEIESVSMRKGYGARLSAPGYLDCTEWSVFDTPKQARAYLDEYYPEDEFETEES